MFFGQPLDFTLVGSRTEGRVTRQVLWYHLWTQTTYPRDTNDPVSYFGFNLLRILRGVPLIRQTSRPETWNLRSRRKEVFWRTKLSVSVTGTPKLIYVRMFRLSISFRGFTNLRRLYDRTRGPRVIPPGPLLLGCGSVKSDEPDGHTLRPEGISVPTVKPTRRITSESVIRFSSHEQV